MEPSVSMILGVFAIGIIATIISVLAIKFPKSFGFYVTFYYSWRNRDFDFTVMGEEKMIKEIKFIGKIYLILSFLILFAGVIMVLAFYF